MSTRWRRCSCRCGDTVEPSPGVVPAKQRRAELRPGDERRLRQRLGPPRVVRHRNDRRQRRVARAPGTWVDEVMCRFPVVGGPAAQSGGRRHDRPCVQDRPEPRRCPIGVGGVGRSGTAASGLPRPVPIHGDDPPACRRSTSDSDVSADRQAHRGGTTLHQARRDDVGRESLADAAQVESHARWPADGASIEIHLYRPRRGAGAAVVQRAARDPVVVERPAVSRCLQRVQHRRVEPAVEGLPGQQRSVHRSGERRTHMDQIIAVGIQLAQLAGVVESGPAALESIDLGDGGTGQALVVRRHEAVHLGPHRMPTSFAPADRVRGHPHADPLHLGAVVGGAGGGGGGGGAAVGGGVVGAGSVAPAPTGAPTGAGDGAGVPTDTLGVPAVRADPAVEDPPIDEGAVGSAPPMVGSDAAAGAGGDTPGGSGTTTWRWTWRTTTTVEGGTDRAVVGSAPVGSAVPASTATTPNIAEVLTPPRRIFEVNAGWRRRRLGRRLGRRSSAGSPCATSVVTVPPAVIFEVGLPAPGWHRWVGRARRP